MRTLNERAWRICDAMAADAELLGIDVHTLDCGTRIIDCGVKARGSLEAGRRLAEICLAGLAAVELTPAGENLPVKQCVQVLTDEPVAACMASQYAGWEIKGDKFFAMGSGPMRAAAGSEELFNDIGHRESPDQCVGVLEAAKLPPAKVCIDIATKCRIASEHLTLLVARTASGAGTFQIVARSVETALHKLHVLGFDLTRITRGSGIAPLPPIAHDDLTAIGWTNDAILYGASVRLTIRGGLRDVDDLGRRVPASASPDYGRPFVDIFSSYDHDFYRIDPMLFSPGEVTFVDAENEEASRTYGRRAPDLLKQSFAGVNHAK